MLEVDTELRSIEELLVMLSDHITIHLVSNQDLIEAGQDQTLFLINETRKNDYKDGWLSGEKSLLEFCKNEILALSNGIVLWKTYEPKIVSWAKEHETSEGPYFDRTEIENKISKAQRLVENSIPRTEFVDNGPDEKYCSLCGNTHAGKCSPDSFEYFECSSCGRTHFLPWDAVSLGCVEALTCVCGESAKENWSSISVERHSAINGMLKSA